MNRAVVLGAPRSGTTFLMSVLDAVPAAECVTGNMFPIPLAHLAARGAPDDVRAAIERSLRGALEDYADSALYRSKAGALRKWWVASRRPGALPAALRGERRESVMVYKEPFLGFSPELVFEALPGARIVHLLRDGRDVADSLVRSYDVLSDRALTGLESNEAPLGRRHGDLHAPWWVEPGEEDAFAAADQYARAIWMWREIEARCQRFLAREDVRASGRVLTVRYEELMGEPEAVGPALFEHLGVRPGRRARRRLAAAHERSIGVHGGRDEAAVRRAEQVAGEQLRRCGYEPRLNPAATQQRA